MTPVARVFDRTGESYYVSSTGKRIAADLRYHLDVPIVSADFDSIAQAKALLPVLDYIKADPTANALVSAIKSRQAWRHNTCAHYTWPRYKFRR